MEKDRAQGMGRVAIILWGSQMQTETPVRQVFAGDSEDKGRGVHGAKAFLCRLDFPEYFGPIFLSSRTDETMERNTDKLVKAFQSGYLVKPGVQGLSFVDLVNALARLAGLEGAEASPGAVSLCRKIGKAEHYLFVLVDGLGMNLVHRLPRYSMLRSAAVAELQAVFLSTTASALATLATAQWPCFHSVPGWWTRLERPGITAVTLTHTERTTQKSLSEFGVTVEELFPWISFWPRMHYEPLSVLPAEIVDTHFSIHARGGTARIGYTDLKEAVKITSEAIWSAPGPSFTYLYLPQVDTLSHREGPEHEAVVDQVLVLDQALAKLVVALAGRARIVISADHGQAQVPEADRFVLFDDDPILRHLKCAPAARQMSRFSMFCPIVKTLLQRNSLRDSENTSFCSPSTMWSA
jgi:hypothetical protein